MESVNGKGEGQPEGLYIQLISVHGLVRGYDMELGRDADTGGQIKYVVELARALSENPRVAQVELLTRQVIDPKVDPSYAEPEESLGGCARIVRLPCGPRRYLRKEVLWPHFDTFVDHALQHIRRVGRVPDIVHSHYADAGYIGARIAALLGVPQIHTGHSLGRDKLRRLLEKGTKQSTIEHQYSMTRRIEAEEASLDSAALVIASTHQEVEQQYKQYDNYHPRRMMVIPPGVDLTRFSPPQRFEGDPPIALEVDRFLDRPKKPMILALSRPDERKNIATLVRAYGESPELRERANLVIIAGNRDDIRELDKGAREVLTELLMLIDRYDLYGQVAYPKHHAADDVPLLYRLAAKRRGVFINPALIEPFGLTLLEAAASGLPVVSTNDGGPRDIQKNCNNGVLIDPLDAAAMGKALLDALTDTNRWRRWSRNGINGTRRHYSWAGHAESYLDAINRSIEASSAHKRSPVVRDRTRLPTVDRVLVCNIDDTLLGDQEALHTFVERLRATGRNVGWGLATGRSVESATEMLNEWDVPCPDLLITGVGTDIRYGQKMIPDQRWQRHIEYRWHPEALVEAMAELEGVELQESSELNPYKISYYIDEDDGPSRREIARHLRTKDLHANVIVSYEYFLDLLPIRASKGLALRYLAMRWGLPLERILVAADSGNDAEMLCGNVLGVVVGNHAPELNRLRGQSRIHFAEGKYAAGILEGIDYYDFLGEIRIPADDR
ncbi:HAD-IIB family hydrolase [Endothiovibrio diazotrophicus]